MFRSYLPLLACGLMVLVCMAPMVIGRRGRQTETEPTTAEEVAALRAELDQLRGTQEAQPDAAAPSDTDAR